jgi:gas vesicle protein
MQGIDDTVDRADDAVDDTVDRAQDTARDTARDVSQGVDRTVDRAEDTVDDTVDRAQDTARDVSRDVQRSADRAVDRATDTVEDTADRAERTVDNTVDRAQDTARDVQRSADRAVDQATETADDVASGVSRSAGEVADATRDQVDHATDTYGEMGRELQDGDVGAAVDTAVESTGETYDNLARAGDAAAGSTDEYVGSAEVNTDVSDDLTRGGFLSENRNDNSGLLPGEVGGVNLSEQGLRSTAGDINDVKKSFDENEPVTFMGSDAPERVLQGAAGAGVDFLNFPQHALMLETGAEVAQNAPGEIQEHGFGEVAETATGVGAAVGGAMAREAESNPLEFASGTAFGFVTGAGIGKAASKAGKAADSARLRAGKQKVDMDEVTNPDTIDYYEGRNTDSENLFPGFDSRSGEAPDETIRRQGEEYTPDEVKEELGPAAEDETYLTHMTNYDFDQSFEAGVPKSRPSDPDNAMFWGPEGSPNFAGFDPGEGTSTGLFSSLKPRLPRKSDFTADTNDALMSRMRVDVEPDRVGNEKATRADPSGADDFNDRGELVTPGDESHFLSEEAEQGTAYVRNQNNRNLGEAETVVPGGSEFRELSSDYYSELGGELVNVRLFDPVDADRRGPIDESGGVSDADIGGGGIVDETGGARKTYAEIVSESGRQSSPEGTPVLPPFTTGTGGQPAGSGSSESDGGPSSPPLDEFGPTSPIGSPPSSGGPSSPPLDEFGPSSPPSSGPSSPPSSGPSSPPSSGPPSSPPLDEFGPTSPTGSPPSSGGPSSPPLDEFGPTSPTSPPGSSGPSSPPSSGPPSSPPGSPPPWSPPGSYGGGSSTSSPGSPSGPGGSSGGVGPSPFDPTQQQRRRDFDDERKKDEEEFTRPAYGQFDVAFQNPIASGAQVLFGGGGFGGGFGALDESGGLQDAGGFGDELSQNGMIDESGGFGSFGQLIDETGGLDDWTPF